MKSKTSIEPTNIELTPLSHDNLNILSEKLLCPTYDRYSLKCGIAHMSVGGFHRAHQAVYIDDLMTILPGDWLISAIGLLPSDKENILALSKQDNLYTVIERSAEQDHARVIGSIKESLFAPHNETKIIERLVDPAIRIVSLTITEKGYCYDTDGNLDTEHPSIQNDLKNPDRPQSALGYIISALARRRSEGTPPFTVMSCDNLPGNGHLTNKLVLQFANIIDKDFASWVEGEVAFPNAMVDRITPKTTEDILELSRRSFGVQDEWPVVCENYRQWVLEDNFCNGRPNLEQVGVQMVEDVAPYEKMKVRLLNGSHSALSYLAYLCGHRRVDLAMQDPLIYGFVKSYMDEDISPCIQSVPGINLQDYKNTLLQRFSNPAIADQVQRLAEDGSQKIPNAILPCIQFQLKAGGSIKWMALALAGWFRYLTGVDETLTKIDIIDPFADRLCTAVKLGNGDPLHVLAIEEIFGSDLRQSAQLISEITKALALLNERGARHTLQIYLEQTRNGQ